MGYTGDNIKSLKPLEAIRKKLGMYAGSSDEKAITQSVKEILANSIDEALLGYGNKIEISLDTASNTITIRDFGRGIPLDKVVPIFTQLHTGGKFKTEGDSSYTGFNSGTHGAGLKIPTALGKMQIEIQRDGKRLSQTIHYEFVGEPTIVKGGKETYTKISWTPDNDIPSISDPTIQPAEIRSMIEWLSYTVEKVEYVYSVDGVTEIIKPKTGADFLQKNYDLISPIFGFVQSDKINTVALSFAYTSKSNEIYFPFLNTTFNDEGGTHLVNFKTTFTRLYNKTFSTEFKGNEIRSGIVVFLNVSTIHEPSFTSQSKNKVDMPNITTSLNELYKNGLETLFATESFFKNLGANIEKQQKKERAMEKIREMLNETKTANKTFNAALGKLKPALNKTGLELFLVEGDSAGGSLIRERNIYTQSIMPLRGKVINVIKNDIEKVLANEEIKDLIKVIGGFGEDFNPKHCAYNKIIFCLDADKRLCP